ncbi:MAG: YfhO family protein [Hungatella sp.]|nr:YfhO family protein [Hungatella sp.]
MEHDDIKKVTKEMEELLSKLSASKAPLPEREEEEEPVGSDEAETNFESTDSDGEETYLSLKNRKSRSQEARKERKREQREEKKARGAIDGYLRPVDGLWAAFCIPVVIMVIIFAQRGIFPFGEESFLRTDMYHQYAPFFSEFQYKLSNGRSLLYSWNIGMGINFSALYAYYLASPLNWLLILCPKNLVIEFMTYSIVLKIGLSGLSFAWYLRKHGSKDDFGVAFFGIFYALSGYMAAYSWNIMWLDCILLFPLVMLGLERLVKEKKGMLYGICLGICILSNYYISIMICIFMVIYFFALLILESGEGRRVKDYLINCGQFGFYSLMAGGMAAAVLLPEIYALQMTASGDFNFPKTVSSYFSIFDMFARHIGNVEIEIGLDHWPNIYCGVAVLMFFLLYLGCRKIKVREKAVYCGLLLLFFASFSVNTLNFVWHGFHFPNSLPCRQSFIYIFLMLVICYRAYSNLGEMPWKYVAAAFWGSVSFVILAEKLVEQEHFQFYMYYIAILFLSVYAGLIYLYKYKKKSYGILMILALAVVSVEAAVNTTLTSVTTTSRTNYIKDNGEVERLVNTLLPAETFYRIEKVTRKTKNDGAWMNFPTVSLFSSTANSHLTAFFKDVGCEGNTNAYSITGSTPLIDSLFSVKYGLYSEEHEENPNLMLLSQDGGTWLYMRHDTLPVGFMVDPDMEDVWLRDLGNPALVQNNLCDIIGADQVLVEADSDSEGNKFRFTPEVSGDYYVYVSNKAVEEAEMKRGENTETFKNINRGFLLELGWCQAGEPVLLTGKEDDVDLRAKAYRFDFDALHSVYEILNSYPLNVTKWTDTVLEGEVNAGKAGTLFTSIPYDAGWTVKVDGQVQETGKIFDTFVSAELTEGSHKVSFSYEPEGFKTGIWITIGSIMLLFVAMVCNIELNKKKRKREER